MKKYTENQTISLFVAEDGSFRLVTEDSDEVLSSEYPKAIAAYFTARMNEALSKGFSAEDFIEVSAVTEQTEEDPISDVEKDVATIAEKEMEEDFNKIKWVAYNGDPKTKYDRWFDEIAFENMQELYWLYRQRVYSVDEAEKRRNRIYNHYVTIRKQIEALRKMYLTLQEAIKKTSEKLTHLIKNADKMSKDELIDELLNIVSLAIGEEVTAKQIRKKLKGSVDD